MEVSAGGWVIKELKMAFKLLLIPFKAINTCDWQSSISAGRINTRLGIFTLLGKRQIPVFEIETNSGGLIKTTVDWSNN